MLILVAACGAAGQKGTVSGLSKEDAVFEAVVLHDMTEGKVAKDEAICLVTRGATSDGTALRAALAAKHPVVVADGECTGGGPDGSSVTRNGGKAVRIDIGPVKWVSDTVATIESGGAYRMGGVREVEYRVEKTADGWKVVGEKLLRQI